MTPLVSPSAHIYLSTSSVGTAAPAGVCVCVCVCVSDQCLSRCLRPGVCVHLLSFNLQKLKSLVATYQRDIESGHTCDGTQPSANALLCASFHPIIPLLFLLKLSRRRETVFWHRVRRNPASWKRRPFIPEAPIARFGVDDAF